MSRSTNKRSLGTLVALVLVPVAAVAVLGVGLGTASGDSAPGGLLLNDTRAFTAAGENLAADPAAVARADETKVDEFLTDWQNTVRSAPSPKR